MTSFEQHLQINFLFTESEINLICSYFKKHVLKKGTHLLEEGQRCESLYYVNEGVVLYYQNKDGEEKVCNFGFEGDWVTSYESLLNNKPSSMNIKTIGSVTLHQISLASLHALSEAFPRINEVRIKMAEKYFMESNKKANLLSTASAEERYTRFITDNPRLAQEIPQYYLASFLGIKPQSLSRIRAAIK